MNGITELAITELLSLANQYKENRIFEFKLSYTEIYNEQLKDLFNTKAKLSIKESSKGVIISNLSNVKFST